MAYDPALSVGALASANQDRTCDVIRYIGMPAFQDYSRPQRYAMIDSYPGSDDQYIEALEGYQQAMANTVGLVCTANTVYQPVGQAEGQRHNNTEVGLGLAVRGIVAVIGHELVERIGIEEARFLSQPKTKRRAAGDLAKGGPAEIMAQELNVERPLDVYDLEYVMNTGLSRRVADGVMKIRAKNPHAGLEATSLAMIKAELPTQTHLERGVYRSIVTWSPRSSSR